MSASLTAAADSLALANGNLASSADSSLQASSSSAASDATALAADASSSMFPMPEVRLNGRPASTQPAMPVPQGVDGGWGSNFWVTLVDPQTQISFYACPATGEVSWDPPVGNFLLPPNPDGEWWEMIDESSGVPYYHHTRSGETVWERPEAFVIPLATLQNTALGRRLSIRKSDEADIKAAGTASRLPYRRSHSYIAGKNVNGQTEHSPSMRRRSQSSSRSTPGSPAPPSPTRKSTVRRVSSNNDAYQGNGGTPSGPLSYPRGHPLAPIPGSPYNTDHSPPPSPSPSGRRSTTSIPQRAPSRASAGTKQQQEKPAGKDSPPRKKEAQDETLARSRSKSSSYMAYRVPQPQSLTAALEMIALSTNNSQSSSSDHHHHHHHHQAHSEGNHGGRPSPPSSERPHVRVSTDPGMNGTLSPGYAGRGAESAPSTPSASNRKSKARSVVPPSPQRPTPSLPLTNGERQRSAPRAVQLRGKDISGPMLNPEAPRLLQPVTDPATGQPIPVEVQPMRPTNSTASLNTGRYPILPSDLASDIQQFAESQFARQYFSTHRTGFIFRRKVPVEQLMTWQKAPLNAPLLTMNKSLHKDAIKVFKVIQHIMGDRERDRTISVRAPVDKLSSVGSVNGSTHSLVNNANAALLEEERWLLSEGLLHGDLRDEIYCQVMKQLHGNPSTESIFKGWQSLCVLLVTFPPSKNFETYLRAFMQQSTSRQEGRVDVMAKYCLRRLAHISKKGPRGKPPSITEIEIASDAAFNPSIFGESLDVTFRLQERNYPHHQVPIVLPFLADGILALGGTKAEGIFRVPGDGDDVTELKLRINKGHYSLDGVDDPHVLASLIKLWLRELVDPLVPDELYNDCITHSKDPDMCIQLVHRLPTINRRVVLFMISFLQLFLEDKVLAITKMTAPNLALVMAPNLLRCNSESIAVVFTNAQYEQTFVHNLLLHLKCNEVDPDYIPTHGQGALPNYVPDPRKSKSRHRP